VHAVSGPTPYYITVSHEVGGVGLLERENAAVLNATLRPLAAALLPAFRRALACSGFAGRLFLTSNDGTLLSADAAEKVPVPRRCRHSWLLSSLPVSIPPPFAFQRLRQQMHECEPLRLLRGVITPREYVNADGV
jgi:hypothetical protein